MNIRSAAGSQPAAGSPDARISPSTQSTKANMTNPTNATTSAACLDFSLLSNYAKQLAKTLGMDIVSFPGGFAAVKDGDILCDECSSNALEHWFNGYESGKDDSEIADQLDHAKLVLAELVKAEQIIQTLSAQMSDAQKLAATESLIACGYPISGAARCQERRALIAAAHPVNGSRA